MIHIHHGDSREVLKAMPDACFHAVVCDPPYSLTNRTPDVKWCVDCSRILDGRDGKPSACPACGGVIENQRSKGKRGFMGKQWDTGETAFDPAFWAEVYRVLKPGGHLIAFGGTRTYHRLACAIEDAGFEVRDMLAWMFGSGFPKSHNVAKGIDKRGGRSDLTSEIGKAIKNAREKRGLTAGDCDRIFCNGSTNWSWFEGRTAGQRAPTPETFSRIVAEWPELAPMAEAVMEAERETIGSKWAGIATPGDVGRHTVGGSRAVEVDITAPATDAARAWEGWGTALKPAHEPICLARKPLAEGTVAGNVLAHGCGALNIDGCRVEAPEGLTSGGNKQSSPLHMDREAGINRVTERSNGHALGRWPANVVLDSSEEVIAAFPESVSTGGDGYKNSMFCGGKKTGGHGLGDSGSAARFFYSAKADAGDRLQSKHPTVKPVDLMRWLVRLVTPKGGHVLDPFAGSGTTGMACMAEGFDCALIEREAEYVADIRRRIGHVSGDDTPLFAKAAD